MNTVTKPGSTLRATVIAAGLIVSSVPVLEASEVDIPHTFTSGQPAVAAEVNQNFSASANAINDNFAVIGQNAQAISGNASAIDDNATAIGNNATNIVSNAASINANAAGVSANSTRIDTLESTVANLADQIAGLQSGGSVSIDTYYATDLTFFLTNGDLNVPVIDGNVTPPGSVGTGHDWHPYPGLTNVSFTVEEDDTVVLFQSIGQAVVLQFNSFASMEVALRINGAFPDRGHSERIRVVTDDTVSSGGQSWNLLHATTLPAGQHTFSIMVRILDGSANEASMTLDGRSGPGYDGDIKVVLLQVN